MSVLFKTALGNNGNAASGTTLAITTTAAIAINDLVVVRWAADNLSATTPTGAVTDSGGNTYTAHAFRGNNATAAAGIVGGIAATKATAVVALGGTITLTLSGAVTAKAMYAESFTGADNTLRNAVVLGSGASTISTVQSGSATSGDLVIGNMAVEDRAAPTFDSDTTNGAWSTGVTKPNATTGTVTACVETNGQYKIVTATGTQVFNHTNANTDWAAMIAVFQQTPTTPVTAATRATTWTTFSTLTAATRATTWNVLAITVPGAPTGLAATPITGGTSMSLDWDAGATGGSAITDYIVEYRRIDVNDGMLWKGVGSISRVDLPRDLGSVGVSWYYDWANYSAVAGLPDVPATPGVEYVPMMWGDWENETRFDIGGPPSASIGQANVLLGFNEPDGVNQSNVTPARALALWPQLDATGCRLGSPAPAGDPTSQAWLATFMAGNPRVDFICLHWYVEYNSGYTNLGDFLDHVHGLYGLPIWLTEVGSLSGSYSDNVALMDTVLPIVIARPWVERFSWFALQPGTGFATVNLVDSGGSLTASGTKYATFANKIQHLTPVTAATRSTTWNVASSAPTIYTDDFNRADGALGTPWVVVEGALAISSNKVVAPSGAGPHTSRYNQTFTANQWAEAAVVGNLTGGHAIGPAVHINGTDLYYLWLGSTTNTVEIVRRLSGSYATLGSATAVPAGTMALEIVGTTIKAYVNGTVALTVTDANIATGQPGILGNDGSGQTLDNWRGGNGAYPGPLPSFVKYRTFDGISDNLQWNAAETVGTTLWGPGTAVACLRRTRDSAGGPGGGYQVWFAGSVSSGGFQCATYFDPADNINVFDGSSGSGAGPTIKTADGWAVVVVSRGAANGLRAHSYKWVENVWHHDGPMPQVPSGTMDVGSYFEFSQQNGWNQWLAADVAAVAYWHRELSDAEIATLHTSLAAWTALSPNHLWRMEMSPITDTAGTSTVKTISGTTLSGLDSLLPLS